MRETNLHYADLSRKEIARKAGKSDTGKNQEKPDTMSGANTQHQTPCDGATALLPTGSPGQHRVHGSIWHQAVCNTAPQGLWPIAIYAAR